MSFDIRPREIVVHAEDHKALVVWYREVLDLSVIADHADDYNYAVLGNAAGIRIGIADAKQMGVTPTDRKNNTTVLQIDVNDVKRWLKHVNERGGTVVFGPSHDKKGDFWYGGFADLEGNPIWVVDHNCP